MCNSTCLRLRSCTQRCKVAVGVQVQDVTREMDFSFYSQYTRRFPTPLTITDGQLISTICVYDTAERMGNTVGGLGSLDEMCLNSLLTYPETCRAPPNSAHVWSRFTRSVSDTTYVHAHHAMPVPACMVGVHLVRSTCSDGSVPCLLKFSNSRQTSVTAGDCL